MKIIQLSSFKTAQNWHNLNEKAAKTTGATKIDLENSLNAIKLKN